MNTTTTSATSRWGSWPWACSPATRWPSSATTGRSGCGAEIAAQARRRRLGGPLPGLQPHRGGLRHRPLRRHVRGGRGPGAGRQDPRHARQAAQGPARRLHRPARPAEVRAPEAPLLRAGGGEGARARRGSGPALWEENVRPRHGRRRRHHLLHLGHHRLPQGGHALLPEPALHGALAPRGGPQAPRATSSSPSSRWPGSASR